MRVEKTGHGLVGMAPAKVVLAEKEAMEDPPPQTSTGPKTSKTCSPPSKETSKEAEVAGAEAVHPTGATQTETQTQVATQKNSTDSVEPPDCQEMHDKGHHAHALDRHGHRGPQLCRPFR